MLNARRFVYLLVTLCCFAAPAASPATAQTRLPSANEIVGRYGEALGGRAAIMRHTSSTTRGTMEVHDGATVLKLPLVYYARAPFQRLERVSLPNGKGESLNGFDGTVAWSFDPRPGPTSGAQLASGDDRESAKRDADFTIR